MACVGIAKRIDPDEVAGKGHRDRARRFGVDDDFDTSVTRLTVLERDNWVCQICGEAISRDAVYPSDEYGSLDHIVSFKKGGHHIWSNVQAAHLGCNIAKGIKDASEEQAYRAA